VPTLLATVVASLASWLADGLLRPQAGVYASTVISLVTGIVSFHFAKRFVTELRDGS